MTPRFKPYRKRVGLFPLLSLARKWQTPRNSNTRMTSPVSLSWRKTHIG